MPAKVNRILTSHCGSLPRAIDLLDLMKARLEGRERLLKRLAHVSRRVHGEPSPL
jgi:hypothetical protein